MDTPLHSLHTLHVDTPQTLHVDRPVQLTSQPHAWGPEARTGLTRLAAPTPQARAIRAEAQQGLAALEAGSRLFLCLMTVPNEHRSSCMIVCSD